MREHTISSILSVLLYGAKRRPSVKAGVCKVVVQRAGCSLCAAGCMSLGLCAVHALRH